MLCHVEDDHHAWFLALRAYSSGAGTVPFIAALDYKIVVSKIGSHWRGFVKIPANINHVQMDSS